MAETNNQSGQAAANNPASESQKLKKFKSETVDMVLQQINELQESGGIDLPADYSPANALKAAWFTLLMTTDAGKKPVLESCTQVSILNSLLQMATEGLNPAKKQCSFIAYGNTLTMQREYFGSMALAKRYNPKIVEITANVIYKDDVFKYAIDPISGRKKIIEHSQELENIDITKIRGAYATIIFDDGESIMEPMTMAQIKQSWEQGPMKGNSPAHKNFPDEMAKKTVINRICKPFVNSSDDSEVITLNPNTAPESANSKTLDVNYEDVSDKDQSQPRAEDKPETKHEEKQDAPTSKQPQINF